jgi:hypothetical protein
MHKKDKCYYTVCTVSAEQTQTVTILEQKLSSYKFYETTGSFHIASIKNDMSIIFPPLFRLKRPWTRPTPLLRRAASSGMAFQICNLQNKASALIWDQNL